jgi:hypothetical protein
MLNHYRTITSKVNESNSVTKQHSESCTLLCPIRGGVIEMNMGGQSRIAQDRIPD